MDFLLYSVRFPHFSASVGHAEYSALRPVIYLLSPSHTAAQAPTMRTDVCVIITYFLLSASVLDYTSVMNTVNYHQKDFVKT